MKGGWVGGWRERTAAGRVFVFMTEVGGQGMGRSLVSFFER